MTKEELEKEAEEWIKEHSGLIGSYMFVKYDYDSMQKAYLASAEPREKQIEIDAKQIRALQKQNGELTDKVRELEAQIEKMKRHSNCKHRSEYNEIDPYSKVCQSCCNLEKWEFGEIKEK